MRKEVLVGLALVVCGACGGNSGPAAPSTAPPRAIVFLGSDPAPGSTLITTDRRTLNLTVSVSFDAAIPQAQLVIELISAAGQSCGIGGSERFEVVAGRPVTEVVPVSFVTGQCPEGDAERATRLHAQLLEVIPFDASGAGGDVSRMTADLPVSYTLRRYPPPPIGQPPAPPRIEGIRYDLSIAGFPPVPGDPVTFYCVARDPEGDAVTVTLDVRWQHRPARVVARTFQAGASSSLPGAEVVLGTTAGRPPIAEVTCNAIDSHGLAATQRIRFP